MTLGQKTITLAASLTLIASFAAVAAPVFAADAAPRSSLQSGLESAAPEELKAGELRLEKIIGNVISGVMTIVGALLFVYLLYGGFMYMTAGGDEKKVASAVSVIKNAVIGIVIIALSYAIATFIISQLGEATKATQSGPASGPT